MRLGEVAENLWFGFIVLGAMVGAVVPIGLLVWGLYEVLK